MRKALWKLAFCFHREAWRKRKIKTQLHDTVDYAPRKVEHVVFVIWFWKKDKGKKKKDIQFLIFINLYGCMRKPSGEEI